MSKQSTSKSNTTYIKANATSTKRTTPKAAKQSTESVVTDEEAAKQEKLNTPRVVRMFAQTDVAARSIGSKIKGMFKSVVKTVKTVTHNAATRVLKMGPFGQSMVLATLLCVIAAVMYTAAYGIVVGLIMFVWLMFVSAVSALVALGFFKLLNLA